MKSFGYKVFVLLLPLTTCANAQASYRALPPRGERSCPAHGEFFKDHFCWLGALRSQAPACIPCPQSGGDFAPNKIIRGGEPLTTSAVATLKDLGVQLIIDLRTKGEVRRGNEPKAAADNGIAYFNIPMDTGSSASAQKNEQALFRSLGLVRFFLTENRSGKIYFHCQRGEDRTGLLAAGIRLLLEDYERPEIRKEMRQHYFNEHYASLKDVWERLSPEASSRIIEPTSEEQGVIRKTDSSDH